MAALPEYLPSSHTAHVLPTSFSPGKHATQTDDPLSDALPEAHVTHSESPPSAVYLPATQLPHTVAAICAVCAEYLPGEQLLHCVSAAAPCALEYVPLPHGLHVSVVCSVWSPYFPAPHAVHNAVPAVV